MADTLRSQRRKKLFKDEYGYIYTCNNKNKYGKKVYWLCVNRASCNVYVFIQLTVPLFGEVAFTVTALNRLNI